MDRILLSTLVYRSPEEVFPTLRSFERYPQYTEYLQSVRADGDGGVGTIYDLRFRWWKLSYTARSEVREVEVPERLAWRLRKDVDAAGEWRVEPEPESARADDETASRVYFEVTYDPHSADPDAISLPRLVSLDWVIRKIQPKLLEEAERVVRRLVAEIEGEPRDVELVVHEAP